MNDLPKTIICDIDGVLVKHHGDICFQHKQADLLDGTLQKLREWDIKGYNIILMTGRRESTRKYTEEMLSELGIIYDQLIMGVGGGQRVLINDRKKGRNEDTAVVINLTRNGGLKDVEV